MKKFDFIGAAKNIFEIESRVVLELSAQLNQSFVTLCEDALSCNGKLILMGIGKSGHVCQKIAASEIPNLPEEDTILQLELQPS